MPKYQMMGPGGPWTFEAEKVSFNLEYGMIFFNNGDEVVASCPVTTPFIKMKEAE